jgi:hypothetical protein
MLFQRVVRGVQIATRMVYPEHGEINFQGERHHEPDDCHYTTRY